MPADSKSWVPSAVEAMKLACPKSHRRNFTDVLDFMLTLPILAEQKRPTSWCSHGDSAPSAPPSAVAYDVIMCPAAQCRAATEPISLPAAATCRCVVSSCAHVVVRAFTFLGVCRLALGASDDGGGDIGALDERGLTTGGACLSQGMCVRVCCGWVSVCTAKFSICVDVCVGSWRFPSPTGLLTRTHRQALRVETVNMARCVPDSLRFIRRPSTLRARFHRMTRPTRSYASFQALYLWATLAISAWHVL